MSEGEMALGRTRLKRKNIARMCLKEIRYGGGEYLRL
jgi:hypothetical protein